MATMNELVSIPFNVPYQSEYQLSADTAARREKIKRHAKDSLNDIEQTNQIVSGLKRISDGRLIQVKSRCDELRNKWRRLAYKQKSKPEQEYRDKIRDYLQRELNVSVNMRDEDVRCRELGDFLFYHMWRGEVTQHKVQWIIASIYDPLDERTSCYVVFRDEKIFSQFYKRLGDNPAALEYLIYKQPQLLFDGWTCGLGNTLIEHIPYDSLHRIIRNTRHNRGRICMLFVESAVDYRLFENEYRNHTDDLFDLLSIRDVTGRTALHVNPSFIVYILCEVITLSSLKKLIELLTIKDNNNTTAYDAARRGSDRKRLTWLNNQYEHGNYPLYCLPQVLILYNINNRLGAKEEAESIHKAFKSTITSQIELKIMGPKTEVIQVIKKTAAGQKASLLIVCVMSHGSVGTIEDSEGELMTLTSIEEAMCSDQLKEQPKILIAQCCQTREDRSEYLEDGPASSNGGPELPGEEKMNIPYEPAGDHFLCVQSSVCGQTSDRNVLIPYLAEQIKNSTKNDHFIELVTNASSKMLGEERKQIPIVKSTLRGRICLKNQDWRS